MVLLPALHAGKREKSAPEPESARTNRTRQRVQSTPARPELNQVTAFSPLRKLALSRLSEAPKLRDTCQDRQQLKGAPALMCSAESPGPQVVCGKLAGNLAAGANCLHLSSLAIAFSFLLFSNRFRWQAYSPGRRQRRLGQPACSTRWLGFMAMAGVAQTGLSPLYLSLCSLGSNGTWHERFPDPGSFWVAYWGDDFNFAFTQATKAVLSPHQ